MKDKSKTMTDYGFISNLGKTLKELDDTTRNALAVEAKIRPATINELAKGEAKQINFKTLSAIIETLNRMSKEKEIAKKYNVNDVFEYQNEDKKEPLQK
jgi:DNA-binding Xre family transcriptional regulator